MRKDTQVFVLLAATAALLVVIGAFLPWMKLTAPFVGQITKTGLEGGGDGLYTLLMGLGALGLLAWHSFGTAQERPVFIAVLILGAIIAVIAGIDIDDTKGRIENVSAETEGFATASVGEGLYLTLVGGIGLALIGAERLFRHKPPSPAAS